MHRPLIGLAPHLRSTVLLATLALVAACGSDNGTGTDATPASVVAYGQTPASAVIASPVNPAPAVLVENASGEPLPNVRVTFVVSAGDGQIAGASQLTDGNGIATVGLWMLGSTVGPQALTATAGGKTVTFNVNATNTCTLTGALEAGATVNGNLTASPCAMGDGTAAQSWTFTQATGQSSVSFQMHPTGGPTFDTVLLLHRNAFSAFDNIVAFNDDDLTETGGTTDSRLDVILGPGSYVVSGVNYDAGVTGTFTITAAPWSGEMSNCTDVFVTPGITTTQRMDSSCSFPNTNFKNADPVLVYMAQGQQLQFDMSSTDFDPALELYGSGAGPSAQDDNSGGGTSARIVFTAPGSGIYQLVTTSNALGRVGAYTLTVTSVGGAPAGPALASPRLRGSVAAPWSGKGVAAPRLVHRGG
jgi:hypothetical protein